MTLIPPPPAAAPTTADTPPACSACGALGCAAALAWTVAGVLGTAAPTAAGQPDATAHQATSARDLARVHLRHLQLDLRLDWGRRQAIGRAVLDLQATLPVRHLPLQAQDLDITEVQDASGRTLSLQPSTTAGGLPPATTPGTPHPTTEPPSAAGPARPALPTVVLVDLGTELAAGSTTRLHIHYRTRHVQQADPQSLGGSTGAGLRWFEPTATDPRRRRQVWTSGDPGTQAWWMPLPAAMAQRFTSEITLTVARPLVAVASGAPAPVEPLADGQRRYRFLSSVPHTAQRLGFVVGEFVEIPQHAEGVRLMNWSYPDEAAATAASVEALPGTLGFLNQLTGLPYGGPHFAGPSFTQVFVQDHPWGHPGQALAVQSENMVDDYGVHADFQYLWDLLQAENLAHQWFGGVYSACDARHTWLERGFARYASALHAEHMHGPAEMQLWVLAADHAAARAESSPLVPATLDDERAFATGPTPVSRGAAVLHLLRRELGDAVFQRTVQDFVRASAGRSVCSAALQHAAQRASGRDLGWFFRQWVDAAGYPAFTVRSHWQADTRRWTLVVQQTPAGGATGFFQGRLEIEIDGRIDTVQLKPQAENRFEFERAQPPRWTQLDPRGSWLMTVDAAEAGTDLDGTLLHWRHGSDAASRQQALDALGTRWPTASGAQRRQIVAAVRSVAAAEDDRAEPGPAATPKRYWRERFNALTRLRTWLQAPRPQDASALDSDTRAAMLRIAHRSEGDGSAWLRSTALRILGDSRDPSLADVYLAHLGDASDRVINAAAIALGRTGDARAWPALSALRHHPSWKHQSLISALAGLRELGDPRGADVALAALEDVHSTRWVLATAVWDYPVAAAQTLAALGQGARGVPVLRTRLDAALQGRDTTDVFYTLLLLATLGDEGGRPAFALVRARHGADAGAQEALAAQEAMLEQAIAVAAAARQGGATPRTPR